MRQPSQELHRSKDVTSLLQHRAGCVLGGAEGVGVGFVYGRVALAASFPIDETPPILNVAMQIRRLEQEDPSLISSAFAAIGGNKPKSQYEQYLSEQADGSRTVLVAAVGSEFAGYLTVCWTPEYPPFREHGIPEIQDLNVLPAFRRQGIATALVDKAERLVAANYSEIGIGVGLHPGYNAAQRMYGKRGYVPDGRGLTYRNEYVAEGDQVVLDDDLVLYLTKDLE